QLDLHRAGRMPRLTDKDGVGDGTIGEVPDADTAAQVHHVTAVDMERQQWADKVARDHEVVRFVNRDTVRTKSVRGRIERPCFYEVAFGVVFDHASGIGAIRATHKRNEKATV